jgi:hypothetical protein
MNAFTSAVMEVWGLFVEDASFTVAIVACLVFAWLVMPAFNVPVQWRGAVLFVLLGVALIENVWRTAGRRTRP